MATVTVIAAYPGGHKELRTGDTLVDGDGVALNGSDPLDVNTIVEVDLDATDIANQYADTGVTLPVSQYVSLQVAGAPAQVRGVDWEITSAGRVYWAGLGLSGLLEAGDHLTVTILAG